MSWETRIQTKFIITCGDGNVFTPFWPYSSVSKEVEFNVTEFNFPGTEGTFVDRRLAKGAKYALDIWFQGADHLDEARRFETSAKDPRPWIMEHPMYGRIRVQPIGLFFDNSGLNNSRITGTMIETIEQGNPVISQDPSDIIANYKIISDTYGDEAFTIIFSTPDDSIRANLGEMYDMGANSGAPQLQQETYSNLFNDANAALLNATSDPLAAIRAVHHVMEYPARFEIALKNRLGIFQEQLNLLFGMVPKITSQSGKYQFESNAGSVITSMCLAASLPQGADFLNIADVVAVIDQIVIAENTYILLLDSIQTANGGNTDSYIPDFNYINSVVTIVNYTISNLFVVAMGARQERRLFLEYDSNLISLAHRFYGLSADDSEISDFKASNNIGLSEILLIHKGREIVYFIQ